MEDASAHPFCTAATRSSTIGQRRLTCFNDSVSAWLLSVTPEALLPGWPPTFLPASSPAFLHSLRCPGNEGSTGEGGKEGPGISSAPSIRTAFHNPFWAHTVLVSWNVLVHQENSNGTSSVRTFPMLKVTHSSDPSYSKYPCYHTSHCDELSHSLHHQPQHGFTQALDIHWVKQKTGSPMKVSSLKSQDAQCFLVSGLRDPLKGPSMEGHCPLHLPAPPI